MHISTTDIIGWHNCRNSDNTQFQHEFENIFLHAKILCKTLF
jgi:hypothetical protein